MLMRNTIIHSNGLEFLMVSKLKPPSTTMSSSIPKEPTLTIQSVHQCISLVSVYSRPLTSYYGNLKFFLCCKAFVCFTILQMLKRLS